MEVLPLAIACMRPGATGKHPRFGWSWAGHTALEKAGVELQSDAGYKRFLKSQLPLINQTSIDQDRLHMGPGHFVNLETMAQARYATSQRVFDDVDRFFSTAKEKRQAADFQDNPLQKTDFNHFTNVFERVCVLYRQLISQLRGLKQPQRLSRAEKAETAASIAETVGALSHYVGDLHQPLHTTHYYSWPLAHSGRGGSHAYLEGSLFQARDYPGWQRRLLREEKGSTRQRLSIPQVEARMLREIEQGYLQVFPLVAIDRNARQQADAPAYFSELRKGWKELAAERMNTTARNLADLLHSAFVAAGSPDLQGFRVKSSNRQRS